MYPKNKLSKKDFFRECFLIFWIELIPSEKESEKVKANIVAIIRLNEINDGIWESLVRTAVYKCPK